MVLKVPDLPDLGPTFDLQCLIHVYTAEKELALNTDIKGHEICHF